MNPRFVTKVSTESLKDWELYRGESIDLSVVSVGENHTE